MPRRTLRLGAWIGSIAILLATNFGPFAPLVAAAASDTSPEFTLAAETDVVINEVVPNAATEYVEIYNKSAAGTPAVDISGWRVKDAANNNFGAVVPASTSLAPGAFYSFTGSGVLNNSGSAGGSADSVKLYNAAPTPAIVDQMSYGEATTDTAVTPGANLALARVPDGSSNWYSGAVATRGVAPAGLTNGPATGLPAFPGGSTVKAGASNAANSINLANRSAAAVDVPLGANSLATDTVTVLLTDSASTLKSKTAAGSTGAGTVTASPIDTTAATAFVDGPITVRSYVTNAGGISTAYVAGTPATRDTVAPSSPTAASVLAGANNATNVINSSTVAAVSVSVTLPASSVSTDTVKAELSDGTNTISKIAAAPNGGGPITLADLRTASLDTRGLTDGLISVTATLIDSAGNASVPLVGSNALKDTAAPTGSLQINNGASVTNTTAVTLAISASDVGSGVDQMRIANTNDFAGASFEPFAATKNWALIAGQGSRSVYLQIRDAAGNVSPTAEARILLETSARNITQVPLATGTQTVRQLPMEATVTATAPTNLTFATYQTNPGSALPAGTTGLGRFVEIGVADPSKIAFPVLIKLYYTAADLAAAGITNENQLEGLGYLDQATQSWKFFNSTGVSTADVVVDGQSFAGYLFANADHLTPITGLADTTPPAAPASLTATPKNGAVDVTWSAGADISAYVVRYRLVGDPNGAYFQVVLPPAMTATTVTNLENDRQYEFGVAARDAHGNTSAFTTVLATPEAPAAAAPTPPAPVHRTVALVPRAQAAAPTPQATVAPAAQSQIPLAPTPPVEKTRDLSRLLVTLAILIIAIGAGTAGYYGYQWWTTRPVSPNGGPASAATSQGGPTAPAGGLGGSGGTPPPTVPPAPPAPKPKAPAPPDKPTSSGSPSDQPPSTGRW